jgi:hypothetical protein
MKEPMSSFTVGELEMFYLIGELADEIDRSFYNVPIEKEYELAIFKEKCETFIEMCFEFIEDGEFDIYAVNGNDKCEMYEVTNSMRSNIVLLSSPNNFYDNIDEWCYIYGNSKMIDYMIDYYVDKMCE